MESILYCRDLTVKYTSGWVKKTHTKALRGVSFDLEPGETLGLVGESGSGKSTIGKVLLGLEKPSSGTYEIMGTDLGGSAASRRKRRAKKIQGVFQDPFSSLHPKFPVGKSLVDPLVKVQGLSERAAKDRVLDALKRMGLGESVLDRWPREFSGGQRQRLAIARGVSYKPQILVCDEIVSALDLTTQRSVLEMLIELQNDTGVSMLFITHDLEVVRVIAHRTMILKKGKVVEEGTTEAVIRNPSTSYGQLLKLSAPMADPKLQKARREELSRLIGERNSDNEVTG